MLNWYTRIGEHRVRLATKHAGLPDFLYRNYPLLSDCEEQSDLMIQLVPGYGTAFLGYEVSTEWQAEQLVFTRADYRIVVEDDGYRSCVIAYHDELALKHALMNLYSAYLAHKKWGLLLHASCACSSDGAHVFTGHSGAGKSTAAKLSAPRPILADEAILLKVSESGIIAYNSPFRSEMDVAFPDMAVKLKDINLLVQSESIRRSPVKRADAYMRLMDKLFYWPSYEADTRSLLHMLEIVVQQVPVYELYFQPNNRFWECIEG